MKLSKRIDEALEAVWTSTEAGEPTLERVIRDGEGVVTAELLESMAEKRLML